MYKRNYSAELIIAKKELAFQNREKKNRATELVIANKELIFQNREKRNRAAELLVANKKLALQNEEKESRAAELTMAYNELKVAEEDMKKHIHALEEMMFMISHKVRQPVANILGISNILSDCINTLDQQKKLVKYLKISAITLDTFTRELTAYITDLEQKGKNKLIPVNRELAFTS